jgi:hypothetical protein
MAIVAREQAAESASVAQRRWRERRRQAAAALEASRLRRARAVGPRTP